MIYKGNKVDSVEIRTEDFCVLYFKQPSGRFKFIEIEGEKAVKLIAKHRETKNKYNSLTDLLHHTCVDATRYAIAQSTREYQELEMI